LEENKNIQEEKPATGGEPPYSYQEANQDDDSVQAQPVSEEQIPLVPEEPETKNLKPETETMEVHHHGHVHEKKKWKEYLFQFLMLFLAITLGFFVENQREHYIEHKRAKEFAGLLIDDLNVDIAELNRAHRTLSRIITAGDSLASLLSSQNTEKIPGGKLYYYEYWSGWRWQVISRDATLQQLKNSGSLRYIKNTLVRKVLDYEESLKVIYLIQNKYESEKIENWNLVQKVFDNDYFDELDKIKAARRDSSEKNFNVNDKEVIAFFSKNIPLNTYDKNVLFELKNWARNSSWSYRIQIGNLNSAIQKAQEAIYALKKEYRLE
jgi:hypothetical protein